MPSGLPRHDLATDVVLLDLPTSIQQAQLSPYQIRSTVPPQYPYPSTEPKGYKRQQFIAARPESELEYHLSLEAQIRLALDSVRSRLHGSEQWCLPRQPVESPEQQPTATQAATAHDCVIDAASSELLAYVNSHLLVPWILSSTDVYNLYPALVTLEHTAVHNAGTHTSVLIGHDGGSFRIPPKSVFILSSIQKGMSAFRVATQTLLPATDLVPAPGKFHLILLDPPWANRSVRHAKAYVTAETRNDNPMLQTMPILRHHLLPKGVVAIWVTNKTVVRRQVVDLMHSLDLVMYEEWAWIKVTTQGEPVTALDGVWRKPYELLLLFRHGLEEESIRRKTIIAVPDLHSRKPSLKSLFEVFMPTEYRALELFARSLTTGWWSWGDEVLKFQSTEHWVSPGSRIQVRD